jgi:hypothetical protein
MKFFIGLHQPSDARHFSASCISVNRLRTRKKPLEARKWMMDSGAFTELSTHGRWRTGIEDYAYEIGRWADSGHLLAAVSQDYMCEPFILAKTGLTIEEHQRLTIERYVALKDYVCGVYIMPVLQGFAPADYVAHIRMYGALLEHGAWVGVGSVCKRNGDPRAIEEVLLAIHAERPDLRLHGFGLKLTALASGMVRRLLYSADSMAWSFSARKQGRNGNDWAEAERFRLNIETMPYQRQLEILDG